MSAHGARDNLGDIQAGAKSIAFPCCSIFFQEKGVRLYPRAEPHMLSIASTLQIHCPNSTQRTTLENLGCRAEQKLRP